MPRLGLKFRGPRKTVGPSHKTSNLPLSVTNQPPRLWSTQSGHQWWRHKLNWIVKCIC